MHWEKRKTWKLLICFLESHLWSRNQTEKKKRKKTESLTQWHKDLAISKSVCFYYFYFDLNFLILCSSWCSMKYEILFFSHELQIEANRRKKRGILTSLIWIDGKEMNHLLFWFWFCFQFNRIESFIFLCIIIHLNSNTR